MNTAFDRPYRPVDLNASLTEAFSLTSMAEQLMEEATSATSGRASLTLARGDEMTIILITLKAEYALDEHPAPAAATVVMLSGSIIFKTSTKNITIVEGESVTFTADILHSVHANEDSTFLVVIGGKHAE